MARRASTRSAEAKARSECSRTGKRCGAGWAVARIGSTSGRRTPSSPSVSMRRKARAVSGSASIRSEEHTSELQSRLHLVCRLLLEKKKKRSKEIIHDKKREAEYDR